MKPKINGIGLTKYFTKSLSINFRPYIVSHVTCQILSRIFYWAYEKIVHIIQGVLREIFRGVWVLRQL